MKIDIIIAYIQRYQRGHEVDFVPPITGIHLAAITPSRHEVRVIHQQVEAVDLVVIQRPNGRRLPVDGTLFIVYDAVHGDRTIHREATIEFGQDGGGTLQFDTGIQFVLDLVKGEVLN